MPGTSLSASPSASCPSDAASGRRSSDQCRLVLGSGASFVWLTLYAIGRSYRLQKQLVALANTDMLTGLPNRRAFVAQTLERLAEELPGYVLIIDADHFKRINDTYGHAVGDLCLQAIASRLRGVTRPEDVIGRIGGEEFGIYVRRSQTMLSRLGDAICAEIQVDDPSVTTPLHLTLSIGAAACFGSDSLDLTMRRADLALY